MLDLVDRLGAAAPVLHIVEDVHWADRSTLDLVRFLATNLTNERAVLLVTLRADAVVPATPLALWVAELARLENAERVELGRLDHDATARLVRQLAGDAADPEFVETTLARSAGNPLFAEQLVMQATQNPGHPALLPATLHELLHARVHALPEDTQSVLRAAGGDRPTGLRHPARRDGGTPRSSRRRRCSDRPSTSTWSRSGVTTPSPSGTRRSARSSTPS